MKFHMTYEELLELTKAGDPLIDEEDGEYEITNDGLIIFGSEDYHFPDLKIVIEEDGLRLWIRDNKNIDAENRWFGPDWCEELLFEDYVSLVHWVYTL